MTESFSRIKILSTNEQQGLALQLHLLWYWREGVPYLFLIPFYDPLGLFSYSSDDHILN